MILFHTTTNVDMFEFHINASHSCIILLSNEMLILNTNYVSIIKNIYKYTINHLNMNK